MLDTTDTTTLDIPVDEVAIPTVKAVDIPNLVDALKKYADAQEVISEFEEVKRKARELIEAHIPDGGAIVYNGREVAYFKPVKGTRISKDLLLAYPKVFDAVQVPNSPRFTVDL